MARYMDDAVWWCDTKAEARATADRAAAFVAERLRVSFHEPMAIGRSDQGLTFLGFRIHRGALLLSARRRRRYRAARRAWEAAFAEGRIDAGALQRGYASALAITAHASAAGFRRGDLERRPALDV